MTTNNFKPILYNTEMVLAILAGRKTQTRRLQGLSKYNRSPDLYGIGNVRINGYFNFYRIEDEKGYWETPKFETGDILWVREAFCDVSHNLEKENCFLYKADFLGTTAELVKWKPSIHMPIEAARIFLKVTNVRCERLQDISEEDAIAEGIEIVKERHNLPAYQDYEQKGKNTYLKASHSFWSLWDSINAKKHPWESNPWVWVYDFERIEKPENFLS